MYQPEMKSSKQFKNQSGFTLLELMITFTIIAILVTIAIPAYSDYVKRARIIEATAAISDTAIKLDQFFLDNRTYVGYNGCAARNTDSFDFNCNNLSVSTYDVWAVGKGEMNNFVYSIDETGTKNSMTEWGNDNTCWVRAKGGKC